MACSTVFYLFALRIHTLIAKYKYPTITAEHILLILAEFRGMPWGDKACALSIQFFISLSPLLPTVAPASSKSINCANHSHE
jgi:hypothetical protein